MNEAEQKRQGKSCSAGRESKKWAKLYKDNKGKRMLHLLHQRKSTEFSGATVTFAQISVLKENNKERFMSGSKRKKIYRF